MSTPSLSWHLSPGPSDFDDAPDSSSLKPRGGLAGTRRAAPRGCRRAPSRLPSGTSVSWAQGEGVRTPSGSGLQGRDAGKGRGRKLTGSGDTAPQHSVARLSSTSDIAEPPASPPRGRALISAPRATPRGPRLPQHRPGPRRPEPRAPPSLACLGSPGWAGSQRLGAPGRWSTSGHGPPRAPRTRARSEPAARRHTRPRAGPAQTRSEPPGRRSPPGRGERAVRRRRQLEGSGARAGPPPPAPPAPPAAAARSARRPLCRSPRPSRRG